MQSDGKRDITDVTDAPDIGKVVRQSLPMEEDIREEDDSEETTPTIDDYRELFDSAIEISDKALAAIDEECKDLVIDVDYEKNPELVQAMLIIFGEQKKQLTYNDYKRLSDEHDKLRIYLTARRMGF